MKIVFALLVGIFIGIVISSAVIKSKMMGNLICVKDMSEPYSRPYMSLSLDKDPSKIESEKYVVFRVTNKIFSNNDSQN